MWSSSIIDKIIMTVMKIVVVMTMTAVIYDGNDDSDNDDIYSNYGTYQRWDIPQYQRI